MAELTKVKKSVMEESQVLPDMDGQSGKVLSNDGSKPRWIDMDNEWRPGDIKMFAGSESQIQAGWQLCNGVGQTSNGINIPDLRDQFIIGSGGDHSTGSKGGNTSNTTSLAGNHLHSVNVNSTSLSTSQIPVHNHKYSDGYTNRGTSDNSIGVVFNHPFNIAKDIRTSNTGGSSSHNHSTNCSNTGNHSHSVNVIPPFYALAFIIKL